MKILYILLFSLSLLLCAQEVRAQTPTLNQFFGKNGIDSGRSGSTINHNIYSLDPPGYPRGVTAGSLIVVSGVWPDSYGGCGSHCLPTFTDNHSSPETLSPVFSTSAPCEDARGHDHGIYYDANVPSDVNTVTEAHSSLFSDSYWNISNWYNVAASNIVGGSSCTTGNTGPNISGTSFSTTAGSIVYVEVDDEDGLVVGNKFTSISVPSGCTVLQENTYQGHIELYCSTSGGTFTPSVTINQGTHDTFTIMAVEFKGGSGGSPPGIGTAVLLSGQDFTGAGATYTRNVGCPTGTSTVVVTDDASYITAVSDSGDGNSGAFTHVTPGGGPSSIWYKLGTSISNPNNYKISVTTPGGGYDLITVYCLNATGIDTGVKAGANTSIVTPGTVYAYVNESGGGGLGTYANLPTLTPGLPGDLLIISGSSGVGPVLNCTMLPGCVNDFPAPVALANITAGDADDYTNGDAGGHFWESGTAQASFTWTMQNNGASTSMVVTAFYLGGTSSPPAAPTNVQVSVR